MIVILAFKFATARKARHCRVVRGQAILADIPPTAIGSPVKFAAA
jgi:hypothetical protein